MKEIPTIERGGGYAEALIEQARADRVPDEVLRYAAAVILHGLSTGITQATETLEEVANYR